VRTTAVYNGQENLCALASSTRLCSCVRRGRIISLFYFGLAPNADPTGLSSSVFLVAIARYWLAFRFKSSLPFSWFLLNRKIAGVIGVKAKDPNNVKRRGDLNCQNDACRWAWKAHADHSVFWSSPLDKQTPLSSKPSTKRPAYACKNLQIVQVNAINPFPIPSIYNAASLGIDCCLRSTSFVFCRVVDVICVIFIGSGSIFKLFLVFTTVIDIFHTVDTIGLCLLFKHDCYISRTVAYVRS
jgi:hypothetical protein